MKLIDELMEDEQSKERYGARSIAIADELADVKEKREGLNEEEFEEWLESRVERLSALLSEAGVRIHVLLYLKRRHEEVKRKQ